MRMEKEQQLLNKLSPGQVYRRSELTRFTPTVDRYLDRLVSQKALIKVSAGLYLRPKTSAFGALPPDDHDLVKSFLKDNRFLVTTYNNYNQLGLGLSQLYGHSVVYNYKRFGEFELGGKKFFFKRVPNFPLQLSKEFLLVDMLNNFSQLAEDHAAVLENLKKKKDTFDALKVLSMAKKYGRPRTKKVLDEIYS
jgi:hypothetical protein